MSNRTSYEPGTFSWVELATPDQEAAKEFYGSLFGWQTRDDPIPDSGHAYTMASIDGDAVAGLMEQPEQQRQAGVPPNWFSYVTVASADATAARVTELGGSVHAPPFDVMQYGRMAVIADPTGAMLGAWEPRDHIGAGRVNDPGCLTWNDLATNDTDAAEAFYSGLFGWGFEKIDTGGGPSYWSIAHDGAAAGRNGGMRELAPEQAEGGVPPHWLPYFVAESADSVVERVKGAGGMLHFGPIDLPTGSRFAVLGDPQGAIFGIVEGETDD